MVYCIIRWDNKDIWPAGESRQTTPARDDERSAREKVQKEKFGVLKTTAVKKKERVFREKITQ